MAPKGPPMTPGPSHRPSPPPRTRPLLSWLFRRAVTFPSVLTSPTRAPMSSEPSPTKWRHSESNCSSSLPSNPTLVPSDALRVQRRSSVARLPTRGSANAAGYDLYSAEAKIVRARGRALVDTQLSVAVPPGTYGRMAPRSGLASRLSIDVGAGVIDADYRGVIYVLLVNHSENDFEVSVGDRIAQLLLERVSTLPVLEVWDLDDHPRTPSASIALPSHLEQSSTLEIEDVSPHRASPSQTANQPSRRWSRSLPRNPNTYPERAPEGVYARPSAFDANLQSPPVHFAGTSASRHSSSSLGVHVHRAKVNLLRAFARTSDLRLVVFSIFQPSLLFFLAIFSVCTRCEPVHVGYDINTG